MSLTTEYLQRRGVEFETIAHSKALTTIEEARALGIQADQLVKTLLLDTERGHALAVIPGDRRLEMHLVARAVGDNHVRLASEPEMQRDLPGIELGAVPPLGGLFEAPRVRRPGCVRARDRGVRRRLSDRVDQDRLVALCSTRTESPS